MWSFDTIISKEYLLSRVSEEEIFERYLGYYPQFDQKVLNTLPNRPKLDRTPGCKFYVNAMGRIMFKDFAWAEGSGDCFTIASQYHGTVGNWPDTLQRIAEDFNIIERTDTYQVTHKTGPVSSPLDIKHSGTYTPIQIQQRPWTNKDLAFWQMKDQGVTSTELEQNWVYTFSAYWFNNYLARSDMKANSFAFQLGYPDKWQIYLPKTTNKNYRFRQSSSQWVIGTSRLVKGIRPIVTKSNADRVFLSLLGFNVANVLTEAMWFDADQRKLLESFGKPLLLYDNDEVGEAHAKTRAELYNWDYFQYPKNLGKDTKDVCKVHGGQYVKELLYEILD